MRKREQLARIAVTGALRCRSNLGVAPWQPLCPVELALRCGVEVRYVDIPSLEGMYWKRRDPVIFLGAGRPPGRQAFTCAHELGHHHFQHGTKIDEVLDFAGKGVNRDTDEYIAEVFAAFLLMPKSAVDRAFAIRKTLPSSASSEDVLKVASSLGVGYRTLIRHLQLSLKSILKSRAEELLRETPKTIRATILGESADTDLVVVDEHWDPGHALDLQIGDYAILPNRTLVEGTGLEVNSEGSRVVIRAVRAGIGRLVRGEWATFVRVSRRRYVGRASFRHLEDPDD